MQPYVQMVKVILSVGCASVTRDSLAQSVSALKEALVRKFNKPEG